MCVPCKIILNQGAQAALDRATKMRELLQDFAIGVDGMDDERVDDFLFKLSCAESEFCDKVNALGPEFAHLVGAGDRWLELMS